METKAEHSTLIGDIKPGRYSDGSPLDAIHYLECKLILKPDRFTSVPSFHEFGRIVRQAAEGLSIGFSTKGNLELRPRIREVIFLDTKDFDLYNRGFILRRRIAYEDGFPSGDPEVVFKFRYPDLQKAAETDVRPNILGEYRIKFKAEMLPLKEKLGGYRMLYSHNAEFSMRDSFKVGPLSMQALASRFPILAAVEGKCAGKIKLVNHTIVEEVLQQLGKLDFGHGVTAGSNAALWRERGDHRLLIGEFAFECKFKRKDELHEKAMDRVIKFFASLQEVGADWIALGATKTGVVYRLKGNPPQAHE
ncbi:MAG TPA: hypothetical protein VHY56_14560 [Candidatus Binataceae bacterium]|jgi:hypothetical protein|nr:hypothetical protein [Candidatus Binataceae bacterium]